VGTTARQNTRIGRRIIRLIVTLTLGVVFATLVAPGTQAASGAPGAVCDFDGDGFGDLAIGAPGEDVGSASDAGAVHIMFGTVNGILAKRDKVITQQTRGIPDDAEGPASPGVDFGDLFGADTACGDYNHDGFSDLVIGIPGEDVTDPSGRAIADAGAIAAVPGGPGGLQPTGSQFLHQGLADVKGNAESGDAFGGTVVLSDFNGDGFDDLAVGIFGEDATVGATAADKMLTGGVQIFSGSAGGLATRGRLFTRDSPGFPGGATFGDAFGAALAAGDFNGDGFDDLAVGVPHADPGGRESAGEVTVILGSTKGLRARNQQRWHLGSAGIQGGVAVRDQFGFALAVGDIDADGFDDLAIGIPGKAVNGASAAGMVSVLFGSTGGLTSRDALLHQNRPGIKGVAAEGDRFGWSVAIGDFDGDGFADLAAGAPDDMDGLYAAGAVNLVYGSEVGLTTRNDRWRQGLKGVKAEAEALDSFGETVLARDFDADGFTDLVIGIPEEDVGAVADAGAISILYGRAGGLRAVGDRTFNQDSHSIKEVAETSDFFGFVGPLRRPAGVG
jgi:hypothetical protein